MASLDDYRTLMNRYAAAHPYLYESEAAASPQDLVSGASDQGATSQRHFDEQQARHAGWWGTLSPEQRTEYKRLTDERNAKNLAITKGVAALFAAGVGGAGMGAFGNLGAVGAAEGAGAGLGTLGGLEALPAGLGAIETGGFAAIPEIGGALGSLGGLEALPAGLGAIEAGGFAAIPELAGAAGAGFGGLSGSAAGLSGGGGIGSEWLGGLGQLGGAGAGGAGASGGNLLQSLLAGAKGLGGGTNWLNLGGNLLGGWMQSNAAGKAADAQLRAGQDANALLKYMYDQSRADQAPYRAAGTSALANIQALLADPSAITKQADYQFGLDQGTKALANSAAARGMTYSGQQGKALQKYGQDYAGTKLNDSYNRLASIAGIGQQATNQTGALGANYANNAAGNITDMGNAAGSAYVGKGNAWNNAIGGALNGLSEQALIEALLNNGG